MTTTENLIDQLQRRVEADGTWEVSSDELADRFETVDYYRAVYEAAQVSVDVYTPDNVGELLVLLDHLTGRDYREAFREAGLYLTHEDRIDLTERFTRTVRHAIVLHTPEPETFRAMLREFRRYDRAEFHYLRTFFDTDELVRRCAEEYLESRAAPALEATVEAYLRLLLQRHIVDLHTLAPALMEILRTVARHEGALPGGGREEDEDDAGDRRASTGPADDRSWALRVLGFAARNPARNEIRDQYRMLMRRYHPDVNPDGLEAAKEINEAYGILIEGT
ncbi:MAG: DnaJ domain-containing protein [Spirochaetota bacterium]